jgi:hypothetical protein
MSYFCSAPLPYSFHIYIFIFLLLFFKFFEVTELQCFSRQATVRSYSDPVTSSHPVCLNHCRRHYALCKRGSFSLLDILYFSSSFGPNIFLNVSFATFVIITVSDFWGIMPCKVIDMYRRFERACCLQL